MMFKFFFLVLISALALIYGDNNYDTKVVQPMSDKEFNLLKLNSTTGGPYTYSQSKHHFYGTAYDGSYIDTYGCCCGQSGSW